MCFPIILIFDVKIRHCKKTLFWQFSKLYSIDSFDWGFYLRVCQLWTFVWLFWSLTMVSLQRQDHVEMEDLTVARESLEVLTVCLMLCPPALEALNKDKSWQTFIKDLLLHCKNRYNHWGRCSVYMYAKMQSVQNQIQHGGHY